MKTPTVAQRWAMRLLARGGELRQVDGRWRLYQAGEPEANWVGVAGRTVDSLIEQRWLRHGNLTRAGRAALATATTTAPAADTDTAPGQEGSEAMSGMGTNRSQVVKRPPISPWTPSDAQQALAHDAEQQRQRILSMEAGRELDALVAEMLGWYLEADTGIWWAPNAHGRGRAPSSADKIPPSSTEAGVAWAMLDRFWAVRIECCDSTFPEVIVMISARDGREWDASGSRSAMPAVACRAALLATLEARPR